MIPRVTMARSVHLAARTSKGYVSGDYRSLVAPADLKHAQRVSCVMPPDIGAPGLCDVKPVEVSPPTFTIGLWSTLFSPRLPSILRRLGGCLAHTNER